MRLCVGRDARLAWLHGASAAMEMIIMEGCVGTHVDAREHVAKVGKVYGGRKVVMKT